MKKIILTTAFICSSTLAVFSQFSDTGYKNYTLGMTLTQAQAVIPFELVTDENIDGKQAYIVVDGVEIELYFYELEEFVLDKIRSVDEKAKIVGNNAPIIGKSRKAVFKGLGNKLVPMVTDEVSDYDFKYLPTSKSKSNQITTCILSFDDENLNEIIVTHNP